MTQRADQYSFDLEAGEAARDEAVDRVSANAEIDFITAGRIAVKECCEIKWRFTTDDVWARIPEGIEPHDRRAMVSVMKHSQREQWATSTSEFRKSQRPEAHAGPKRVWRSLIYRFPKQSEQVKHAD